LIIFPDLDRSWDESNDRPASSSSSFIAAGVTEKYKDGHFTPQHCSSPTHFPLHNQLNENSLPSPQLTPTPTIFKMQFTNTLLAVLASSSLVSGAALKPRALTASQMVANINAITQQSMTLQPVISNIQTGDSAIAKRQSNPFQVGSIIFTTILP
jgi:hypothetical protein